MSLVKEVKLSNLGDKRGGLVAIEQLGNIPFEIKRVYYLYNTKIETPRGFHAHKKLEQFAICVSGSCQMFLDNGTEKKEVALDSPDKGILIERMIWHEMHDFSKDCILLVLANDFYDEDDYIREYSQFIDEIGTENEK